MCAETSDVTTVGSGRRRRDVTSITWRCEEEMHSSISHLQTNSSSVPILLNSTKILLKQFNCFDRKIVRDQKASNGMTIVILSKGVTGINIYNNWTYGCVSLILSMKFFYSVYRSSAIAAQNSSCKYVYRLIQKWWNYYVRYIFSSMRIEVTVSVFKFFILS